MKIAILSNATVEMLARMLDGEHAVWTAPGFGAWVEIALAPPADLISFSPDIIAILFDERFSKDDARSRIDDAVALLAAAFPKTKVIVPDLKNLLSDLGDGAYDERMWKLAKMPWSMDALLEIKKLFTPVKKVLALDLDNTLWKGVVSEDGLDAVVPNESLQREALLLKERGVLLVALSKNDPEDVAPALRDARMLLHEDDFAAMRVNWDAKSLNLSDVARELNLGVDSFVFVDDNPGNRAEMRAALPEVAVTRDFKAENGVFAKNTIREAKAFLNEIAFRESTLLSAVNEIVKAQRAFFEKGPRFLAPLRQKDVAHIVGVHEATISRMATKKYLQCEWGLFEIGYFFTNQVGTDKSTSQTGVKAEIEEILKAHEGDKKPLSDQKIADMLAERGIKIARRTVAKYRAALNINSSYSR